MTKDIFTFNDPAYYEDRRIAFQRRGGEIVAGADFRLRNADGQVIDTHHPTVELDDGQTFTLAEGEHQDVPDANGPTILVIEGPFRVIAGPGGIVAKTKFKPALIQWYGEQTDAYEERWGITRWVPPEHTGP